MVNGMELQFVLQETRQGRRVMLVDTASTASLVPVTSASNGSSKRRMKVKRTAAFASLSMTGCSASPSGELFKIDKHPKTHSIGPQRSPISGWHHQIQSNHAQPQRRPSPGRCRCSSSRRRQRRRSPLLMRPPGAWCSPTSWRARWLAAPWREVRAVLGIAIGLGESLSLAPRFRAACGFFWQQQRDLQPTAPAPPSSNN